jgi:quinol monooxygenase YgiN
VAVSEEPLYLIAVIRPRPERAEEADGHLRALMAGTRAEEGCIYMELVSSPDDADTWLMLEKFRSRPDWEAHMRTEHVTTGNARLADLLREPTELRFYSER